MHTFLPGEGTVKEIDDGYEVTVDTAFEKRACAFSITITEDMTSISRNDLSLRFIPWGEHGESSVKYSDGYGTVFIVLIFISL